MSIAIDRGFAQVSALQSKTEAQATAKAATEASSSNGKDNGQSISTTDFMSLLVAEMKNQDPTQPTDPTQYVQQLVGVNSLEQLIDINKGVSALTTPQS